MNNKKNNWCLVSNVAGIKEKMISNDKRNYRSFHFLFLPAVSKVTKREYRIDNFQEMFTFLANSDSISQLYSIFMIWMLTAALEHHLLYCSSLFSTHECLVRESSPPFFQYSLVHLPPSHPLSRELSLHIWTILRVQSCFYRYHPIDS